ncbi:ribonuclease HI [Parabacteroides sp. PF5-5]|uniref:ribonuclease H family protein n=1 Tax=unclassified Parabacteroides TaxID=2649774 RepID=UPI0024735DA0|nr:MULTISPECIES: ribonuclease H family protein [unclassified Parabacteroides]MDH6303385.1 ribonuclease HI [Parabacteroides sp. PH5-39]MDH6314708.1 ribonuclease HI [Parabacteroides sp. PF5-13]MDH6318045.1 ribonuclease HI [Parabacteroides sp. PH5-13]MDH6322024.1 ribonuclease HI [Parabacteroides sp. PH5-8]MDH6326147.1 ribonuclease HI [Parabacteroides sp. PH5-41]
MAGKKFYVVWKGLQPGVYNNWEECKKQVEGQAEAKYKSFATEEEASAALEAGYESYLRKASSPKASSKLLKNVSIGKPNPESIAVDAACSGNPGAMEYRGVYVRTKQEIFHIGPMKQGTNNVGEFLALVHGLALLKQKSSPLPIYTDSVNAMKWVKNKKCKTLLERTPVNEQIFVLIERAEKWLRENTYTTPIIKWETSEWGEIPADFGRK